MRKLGGRKVFIIHGHDDKNRNALRDLLADSKFEPIVLSEQPAQGARTIIEKFEMYARQCNKAIALFSADDKTLDQTTGEDRFRARQNVLIEVGWFMAELGRDNVLLVVEDGIEVPSDIIGVEVVKYRRSVKSKLSNVRRFLIPNTDTR